MNERDLLADLRANPEDKAMKCAIIASAVLQCRFERAAFARVRGQPCPKVIRLARLVRRRDV
jgi:hypothetical protein